MQFISDLKLHKLVIGIEKGGIHLFFISSKRIKITQSKSNYGLFNRVANKCIIHKKKKLVTLKDQKNMKLNINTNKTPSIKSYNFLKIKDFYV